MQNNTQKNLLTKTFSFLFITLLFAGAVYSQPKEGTGDFDIKKVARFAAEPNGPAAVDTSKAAGATASSEPVTKIEKINLGWLILRLCFYFALIIGAIIFVTWGIKRLGLAGRSKIRGGSMDILEALPLGQNKSVLLVRVTDRVYLLAQTQNQITVLDTITGEKAIELISSSKGVVSITQFKDVFNNFMGKMKRPV
ncbi:MAG: flagellar biosynthetic protein FliO [Chitinivibrionales bacterium]